MDFSGTPELAFLADLAAAVRRNAPEVPFYLAGATARDLLLLHGYGIDVGRQTRDVDLALAVEDWKHFEVLRAGLLTSDRFEPLGEAAHRLRFNGWLEVDLIPFGAIENPDRTIAWPPDGDFVMNVFGFREAYDSTLVVRLPHGEEIRIVSLPALAILKLKAWEERRHTSAGKDAYDLALVIRNYLAAGNHERLYGEASHLLEEPGFDFEQAGAWLLGYDMAALLPQESRHRVVELLQQETDLNHHLRLVGDLPIESPHALALLQSLLHGFTKRMNS
jgi:predicted nucleotidyltransferase